MPRNCSNHPSEDSSAKMRGQGSFVDPLMIFEAWCTLYVHRVGLEANECAPNRIRLTLATSSFSAFRSSLWSHIWRSSRTWIGLILVFLEIFECLVSRTLKKLEIQHSDQKLWPWKAWWWAFYGFLDILTVLTPILTYE